MQTKYLILIFSICCVHFTNIFAEENTVVGRYMTVDDKPKKSQIDLLAQTIQIKFPQNIQTIGDACDYILRPSGYALVPIDKRNDALKTTLTKPLPFIDRDFGPMSLKDGLITLAGPAFYMVQDPVNRMVNFNLKPQFAKVYETKKPDSKSLKPTVKI